MDQSPEHRSFTTADTDESKAEAIRHVWTVSHQTLVLSGPRRRLLDVADAIGAPTDQVIDVSPSRAVLALDGELLHAYQAMTGDVSGRDR